MLKYRDFTLKVSRQYRGYTLLFIPAKTAGELVVYFYGFYQGFDVIFAGI